MITMNNFDFEGHLLQSFKRDDGELCFIVRDICRILDIKNPSKTVEKLDEDEKGFYSISTLSDKLDVLYVTEAGLYKLVMRSHKAMTAGTAHHRFFRCVTHDLLPSYVASMANAGDRLYQQDIMCKLAMVKEARLTLGKKAAKTMWSTLGLPPIPGVLARSCDDILAVELKRFLSERCTYEQDKKVPARQLYNVYVDWCKAGDNSPDTETAFGLTMAVMADTEPFIKTRGSTRMYCGLHLNT